MVKEETPVMSAKKIVLRTVIGILILALLAAAIYFLTRTDSESGEELIPVFTSDSKKLLSLDIKDGDESFTLKKSGGKWLMEGMEEAELVGNIAETLAAGLSNISSPMEVEKNASDLASFGLENAEHSVTLNFDDFSETLLIGLEANDDCYYCRLASSRDVYLISYDAIYLVFSGKTGFLSKEVYSLDQSGIEKISYRDVEIVREGDGWREVSPHTVYADSSVVESRILPSAASINAADIFTEAEKPFGTADFTVTIKTKDGDAHELSVIEEDEGYLVKYNKKDFVYELSEYALSFVDITGFDAASKYIMPIDISEISEMVFSSPDGDDTLSIEAPSSEAPVFYKNGAEADETNFRDFYQEVMALSFTGEGSASGEAEYSIKFTLESGGVTLVEFVPYSEAEYAVRIDGETSFITNRKNVRDVFSYIDRIKEV